MRFLRFLAVALCGSGLASAVSGGLQAAGGRPNVILIVADDLGAWDWSGSGNPHVKTPNLDGLRSAGADLANFVASPSGAPTRAALLSGLHEFRCGVSHTASGRNWIRPGVPLMPEIFGKAGYRTAIIGKWHLGEALPCRPEDRGFQEVFVHGGGGIGQTSDRWGNGYQNPWVRTKDGWQETKGYCTRVFFEQAGRFLKERAADQQPFFLQLSTNAPHFPYIAPVGAAAKFRAAGVTDPAASFYAMIEDIDSCVGELLGGLESLGLAGRTIVVFMGDNGSALGHWSAGRKGVKGGTDEGGVRAPCFIRWPGRIPAGGVVAGITIPPDLLPTLATLAGVALPDGWRGDGVDLAGCLAGGVEVPAGRPVFTHAGGWPGDETPERHRATGFAVRDGRWLLQGLELYDLRADPGQTTSVFETFPAEGSRLLTAYGSWWESVVGQVREPVRAVIGDSRQPRVSLTASDWWPSREVDGAIATGLTYQSEVRRKLEALAAGTPAVAETSGHWKLRAARDGHYQVTISLLPAEAPETERNRLGQLKAGTVHVRAGRREVQMPLMKTATSVTMGLDLNAGEVDLEGWFTGQLAGGGILGAFFATIERVGERRTPEIDLEIRTEPKK